MSNYIPSALPVNIVAVPVQMSMDGQSPLESCGWQAVDTHPHGENWSVVGESTQVLLAKLQSQQEILTEPGGMMSFSPGLKPSMNMGGCWLGCRRAFCAGESCCRVQWKNDANQPQMMTVFPSFPSKVIPINLDDFGGSMYVKRSAWLASLSTQLEFDLEQAPSCTAAFCAGQGCCLTTVKGRGLTFLNVGGTVLKKTLREGEKVIVDTSALVAWSTTATIDAERAGNCCTMFCGGMGLVNTTITGPGIVYIQSMSREKAVAGYMLAAMMQKK